jgi:serine/threonine protein phosphatase 1
MWSARPSCARPSTGGRLVYAVGDVHGQAVALDRLLAAVRADAAQAAPDELPLLVFLGDYVDRGPDSRGVIDRILAAEAADGFEVAALKGNHEDALLRFLDDPDFAGPWIRAWGEATLRAYGVAPEPGARAQFQAAFPAAHRTFLERLPLSCEAGDYLFVHAGVRPGVPLVAQDDNDLLWIRWEFLGSDADFGKVVVHGHTPAAEPELLPNRINVDTGACFTGVLTAVRLHGEDCRFIQARA